MTKTKPKPKAIGSIGELNAILGPGGVVAMRARKSRGRNALVANMRGEFHNPAAGLGEKILDAPDPAKAPSSVKRFSAEEIAQLNSERMKKGGSR